MVSDDLRVSLKAFKCRLIAGRQPTVTAGHLAVWYVYADASYAYEQTSKSGGLGGVLLTVTVTAEGGLLTLQILWF